MKENDQSDYEKKLNMIIEERLTKMESPDYKFAARFSRRDYLITAADPIWQHRTIRCQNGEHKHGY